MAIKAKVEKINLNQIIKKTVHLPRTSSGYTLYTHADTYNKNNADGDIFDEKAMEDEFYKKFCKTTYNSPTNIRRLFITGNKVYIQYYTSMFKGGKQDQGTWMEKALRTDSGKDLFEIAREIADYKQKQHEYVMEKAINSSAEPPIMYSFEVGEQTNNLFKAISCGWVASNIEEFYCDWTALLPLEVFTKVSSNFQGSAAVAKAFLNGAPSKVICNDDIGNLVRTFNSGGIKNIENRFPRLRAVGMISNLSSIMENPQMNKASFSDCKTFNDMMLTWFKANEELIKSNGGLVMYSSFNNHEGVEKYKTKETQYLFDSTLKPWFETHIEKLKSAKRRDVYNYKPVINLDKEEDDEPIREVSAVEAKLVQLENELSKEEFNTLLKLTVDGFGVNQLKTMFSTFTKQNRIKYTSIIGLEM